MEKMAAFLRLSVTNCFKAAVLWLFLSWGHCLEMTCIEVKKSYVAKGLDESEVPFYAAHGELSNEGCFSRLILLIPFFFLLILSHRSSTTGSV